MRLRAILLFVFASAPLVAAATSPCKGDGCIDEASANFVAPYDVFERRCIEVDPENAKQYHEIAKTAFADEDPELLKRLRESRIYSQVKNELELKADKIEKKDIVADCKKSLLNQ
jgi:predicted lipid-binding transport protein (Tim44 family)